MSGKGASIKMGKEVFSHILKNTRIEPVKSSKQLERILKGVANHRRIDILLLVGKRKGLALDQIASALNCNLKTISAHTLKLTQAGLLEKKYLNQNVLHSLSPYGQKIRKFLLSF